MHAVLKFDIGLFSILEYPGTLARVPVLLYFFKKNNSNTI